MNRRNSVRPAANRLFVAIWPDRRVRDLIRQAQRNLELSKLGRLTAEEKIHLTLAFLGDTVDEEMNRMMAAIERLSFAPFSLELDLANSWPRSRVAWLGCSRGCSQLTQLAERVRRDLGERDSNSKPFVPHVTVARNVKKKIHCEIAPIEWRIDTVRLVRSTLTKDGAIYETLSSSS